MARYINRDLRVGGAITAASDGGRGLANQMYPIVNPRLATVESEDDDATLTVGDLNKIYNNTGSSKTIVLTLPGVKESKGKALTVHSTVAEINRIAPVTGEAINLHGSAVVSKYLQVAGVIGNYVSIYSDGQQWIVTGYAGVVTKEA